MLPSIYEFPPFFTRQINEDTWQAQQRHWHDVVVAWCRESGQHEVTETSDVFTNGRIQRTLAPAVAREILTGLVSSGLAERASIAGKSGFGVYVYSLKPAEIAASIRAWTASSGQAGSVVTLYELAEGEWPGLERCTGVDELTLRRAAQILEKQGNAALLREDGQIVGMKLA